MRVAEPPGPCTSGRMLGMTVTAERKQKVECGWGLPGPCGLLLPLSICSVLSCRTRGWKMGAWYGGYWCWPAGP